MKRLIYIILLLIVTVSVKGQVNLLSGNLQITGFPSSLPSSKFLVSGNFNDTKGLFYASDITTGMWMWKGNSYYVIDSIYSVVGTVITFRVTDPNATGFISGGSAGIMELSANGIPATPQTGDSNSSFMTPSDYSALTSFVSQLIGTGTGSESGEGASVNLYEPSHGYAQGQPIYWDGDSWEIPVNDTLIATYVVVGTSGVDTIIAAASGTFTTSIADGFYYQNGGTYSLTVDTIQTPLFVVADGKMTISPIVGYDLINSDDLPKTYTISVYSDTSTISNPIENSIALIGESPFDSIAVRDASKWNLVIGGSGGGSGTVTSISQGVGIIATPNPITTTGTIAADTSVLASKTWVGNNAGTVTGTGTSGTIPVWNSSSEIGDSPLTVTGIDTVNFANTLKHFNSSAARRWGLYTRPSIIFPVPYLKPDASESGNSNIALDIMPRGVPGDYGSEGISWMDICDTDIEQFGDGGSYLRLGITSTGATIRSKKLSGLQKNLALGIQNTDRLVIDTSGRLTASFYSARSDSAILQPKYAFYGSGTGVIYQNPIGNFRVTNPTNGTEEGLQKTLNDIESLATTLPSGSSGETIRHNGSTWVSSAYLKNTDSRVDIGTSSSQLWLGSSPTGNATYSLILRQYQFFTDATTTGNKLLLRDYTNSNNLLIFPSTTADSYIFFPSSATETSTAAIRVGSGKSSSNAFAIEMAPAITISQPGGSVGGIKWTSTITPDPTNDLSNSEMIGVDISPTYSGLLATQKPEFRGISVTPNIERGPESDTLSVGIYIDPTLTGTTQFEGIRLSNTSGKGVNQISAFATNNLIGSTSFGSASAPARGIDNYGETRLRDLTTDTPTKVVGADIDGDIGVWSMNVLADSVNNYLRASHWINYQTTKAILGSDSSLVHDPTVDSTYIKGQLRIDGSTQDVLVDATGYVGINSTPSFPLDVNGDVGIGNLTNTLVLVQPNFTKDGSFRPQIVGRDSSIYESGASIAFENGGIEFRGDNNYASTANMVVDSNGAAKIRENLSTESTTDSTQAILFQITLMNSTSGALAVKVPASPVAGDWFAVSDSRGQAGTNNITVAFTVAAQNLHGTSQNYIMNANNGFIKFIYVNSTIGWIIGN